MEFSVVPARIAASLPFSPPIFSLMQLVLELCRGDGIANVQSIQGLLDKMHTCSTELCSTEQMVKGSYGLKKMISNANVVTSLLSTF